MTIFRFEYGNIQIWIWQYSDLNMAIYRFEYGNIQIWICQYIDLNIAIFKFEYGIIQIWIWQYSDLNIWQYIFLNGWIPLTGPSGRFDGIWQQRCINDANCGNHQTFQFLRVSSWRVFCSLFCPYPSLTGLCAVSAGFWQTEPHSGKTFEHIYVRKVCVNREKDFGTGPTPMGPLSKLYSYD